MKYVREWLKEGRVMAEQRQAAKARFNQPMTEEEAQALVEAYEGALRKVLYQRSERLRVEYGYDPQTGFAHQIAARKFTQDIHESADWWSLMIHYTAEYAEWQLYRTEVHRRIDCRDSYRAIAKWIGKNYFSEAADTRMFVLHGMFSTFPWGGRNEKAEAPAFELLAGYTASRVSLKARPRLKCALEEEVRREGSQLYDRFLRELTGEVFAQRPTFDSPEGLRGFRSAVMGAIEKQLLPDGPVNRPFLSCLNESDVASIEDPSENGPARIVEAFMERETMEADLRSKIARLPQKYREVIEDYFKFPDDTSEARVQRLQRSPDVIRKQKERAIKKLRKSA